MPVFPGRHREPDPALTPGFQSKVQANFGFELEENQSNLRVVSGKNLNF